MGRGTGIVRFAQNDDVAHAYRMCHSEAMAKMIQVRNVPVRLHRELVRRAKRRGQTLTDYIEEVLEREVARPEAEEGFERVRRRKPVDLGKSAARVLRSERS